MNDYNFSRLGMAETNCKWSLLLNEGRFNQRFRGHFRSKQLYATNTYNKHDKISGRHQYGGIASMTMGDFVGFYDGAGRDTSGLGRYTWQTFRGKRGLSVRVLTFYCPCNTNNSLGSAYTQHKAHFDSIRQYCCPRKALLNNIKDIVQEWKEKGGQIIVMGDINNYIGCREIKNFFLDLEMRE
eukprot:3513637-Ditylum_brightwellii.AAC.1